MKEEIKKSTVDEKNLTSTILKKKKLTGVPTGRDNEEPNMGGSQRKERAKSVRFFDEDKEELGKEKLFGTGSFWFII